MKILILGLNYAPEKVGIAVYTSGMAEALVQAGHSVQVIAGQPYYPAWKIMDGQSAWSFSRGIENGVDVTRAPHYIPAKPSGLKRLIHHATFALTAFFPTVTRAIKTKPDVVLTIGPSLIAAPIARLAAKMSGARSWLHIQDFEVEAAFATGLMSHKTFLGKLADRFESTVLRSFDRVSTISPQMCRKLLEKGVPAEDIYEFRNWADIDAIRPLPEPSPFRDQWNITTTNVALYSGNIANKQGIEIIVDAAKILRERTDLSFVVCGEGPNRENLELMASGLTNIIFKDLQPREDLNSLLNLATIHLLPQIAEAADLVLPSKLTNMLASARPVVATAKKNTALAQELNGCGIVVEPGNPTLFAEAIAVLIDDKILSTSSAISARSRAIEKWSQLKVLDSFQQSLNDFRHSK